MPFWKKKGEPLPAALEILESPPPEQSSRRRFWGKKDQDDDMPLDAAKTAGSQQIVYRKLWKAGLAAAIVAALSNMMLYWFAQNFLGVSFAITVEPESSPWVGVTMANVFLVSVIVAIGATLLMAFLSIPILSRFLSNPSQVFWGIAGFFLLFSFAGPLSLPVDNLTKMVLCLMHLMTFMVICGVLTIFSRGK